MVSDRIGLLFEELGKKINTRIVPDAQGCCQVRFKDGIEVQFEPTSNMQHLNILSRIANIPPGKHRENILREALRMNGKKPPLYGIFTFSHKQETLFLFDRISLEELSGEQLFEFLTPFLEKAAIWRDAISKGDVPSTFSSSYARQGGMFGLR